jgi:hypothetical protein
LFFTDGQIESTAEIQKLPAFAQIGNSDDLITSMIQLHAVNDRQSNVKIKRVPIERTGNNETIYHVKKSRLP